MGELENKTGDGASDGAPDNVPCGGEPEIRLAGFPPKRHAEQFPTWFDLLMMIGIFFAALLVAVLCLNILQIAVPSMESELVNLIVYTVQFILAIAGVWVYRRSRGEKGGIFSFRLQWYNSSLVLLGIVLILAVSVVIEPLINLFPDHYMERLNDAIGRGGWALLLTVLLAPVFEEILFRGLILESARRKWGASVAIVLSAAFFGLVHLPILPQALNAFVMGIALGYIYVLTGSLISVIIIHAVNNGLAFLLLELTGTQNSDLQGMIGNDFIYWIVYGVSIAIFVAVMVAMAVIATDKARRRAEITAVFTAADEKKDGENFASGGEKGQ